MDDEVNKCGENLSEGEVSNGRRHLIELNEGTFAPSGSCYTSENSGIVKDANSSKYYSKAKISALN